MSSMLSTRRDGWGYFYGYREGDYRQINVRCEPTLWLRIIGRPWVGIVGGRPVGTWSSMDAAEAGCIAWMDAHPVEVVIEEVAS
jgi:hypothetical protein